MLVRDEEAGDEGAIRTVIAAAFAAAAHSNGREAEVVDRLRASGALAVSLVADQDEAIVGHSAASRVCIPLAKGAWYGIGPVVVRPDRQIRGIGSALINATIERLKSRGAAGCVVLGDPLYYGRFGFRNDPKLRFAQVPPPYFQYIAFDGSHPVGDVYYDPAFG